MENNTVLTEFEKLKKEMGDELARLLDYWIKNSYDIDYGGFLGGRDFYNQMVENAEKGSVLNARILWTFSAAYNFTQNEQYLEPATRAYQYLLDYFWDKENGGLFWSVYHDGSVLSSRKQIYAQGFGIYGLSEYYRATNNKQSLDYAIQLFELIEKYSYDNDNDGYIEALSKNWEKLDDMRLSEKDANEPKSMNTHLHILEPYTNLYRVWKDKRLEEKMKGLIQVFTRYIINSETSNFELFFDYDWKVKSDIISYGHDIEGAWLLAEAAHELGNKELIEEVEKYTIRMVDATIKDGFDKDGSVFYEKESGHLDEDKHWWPQAEAMVGLTYAWKITGKTQYLEIMSQTWKFIKENIVDTKNGEWFWRVNNKGIANTNDVKLGFWKCPYHNSRALMEVMGLLK